MMNKRTCTPITKPIALKRTITALLCLIWALGAWPVSTQTVMPDPKFTAFDNAGHIVSNGKLCTYASGTTTPANTYTSSSLTVANSNPVLMDSAGRANVFLQSGQSYKFVLLTPGTDSTCSTGSTLWTQDGVQAIPSSSANLDVLGTAGVAITAGECVYLSDGSGSKTAGQWFACDTGTAYSSSTGILGMAPNAITSMTSGTIRLAGQVTGLTSLTIGASYFVSSSGAITNTAPTTNRRLVGVADSTSSLILNIAPGASQASPWTVVTTTSTGTQNDFAPGLLGNTILRCNNATLLTITGLAGGYDGQQLRVESVGAGEVDLPHQSASSTTAADRLINFVTLGLSGAASGITPLAPGSGTALYVYDGTTNGWRLTQHVQGAAIEYSGTSTIVGWSGTIAPKTIRYMLDGRTLTVWWALSGTSNSVNTSFTIPYTAAVVTAGGFATVAGQTFDNGAFTASPGQVNIPTGTSLVTLGSTSESGGGAWTNSGTKQTFGILPIEVQ